MDLHLRIKNNIYILTQFSELKGYNKINIYWDSLIGPTSVLNVLLA